MKKIILSILIATSLFGGSVRGGMTDKQVIAAQQLIKLYGYRCDSVNFAMRSSWSGVIDVSCNNNRYSYDIEDIGGRWQVTVD